MMAALPIFFDPSWPRRRAVAAPADPAPPLGRAPALAGALLAVQAALPWRHLLYPGNVLWTEQGFRFSFSVMLMEKAGTADFRVRDPATGRTFLVAPSELLTPHQARMMATQPDMVLQLAQALRAEFVRRGIADPEVRVDAFASLNGRPLARLVDPAVDLGRLHDGLRPKPWILPAPTTPPP